ncbi:glycosyltransferase [Verrucomicrobiaceae bacterium R5-34]|nr:glycosyltransferase [Verrucomicrobiaceae bacterium R5-34]
MTTGDTYSQPLVRPKVLHLLVGVLPGGMETLMVNLLCEQSQSNRCENVVAVLHSGDIEGSLKPTIESVAEFHDFEAKSFFSIDFVKKFKKLLHETQPDVVHCWSYDAGIVAGAIARYAYGIKVCWAIHSMDLPSRQEYSRWRFLLMKTTVAIASRLVPDTIISCSDKASAAHARFGFPLQRCQTVDNGIDTNRYNIRPQMRSEVRRQLGIADSSQVVGFVGRSHPVKRLEDFFAVASLLMQKRADLHLLVLGFTIDELYPAARERYEQLPDQSRIHFLGRQPNTELYLPAMDVTVLTSESEALPMVLMESLACGIPCVSTDVGATRRVVGKHGQCVPPKQPEQFASAVFDMLDSNLSPEKAREHVLEHFSIAVASRRYVECYQNLAKTSAMPPLAEPIQPPRKKVLHLVNDVGYGGAQVLLKRLSIGLKQQGFDQTVVSVLPIETIGKLAPEFEQAGIPVRSLNMDGPLQGLSGLVKLGRILRDEQPDLVQTWMFHSALIGEFARLFTLKKIKTLWSIHHTYLGKESSKMGTRVIHRCLAWVSAALPEKIIYCSKAGLDLHHASGFAPAKSELIFNGTDTEVYRPNQAANDQLRAELNIPVGAPVVGMAGRYHPQKDFANLLRAFAKVQKVIPQAHLLACGPEVTRDTDALRELADACPHSEQVHLIGPRRDMVNIYPTLDLGVLSSCEGEAFPLVLGEAMACEVPCVATDVGDSALIIGDTGKIVPPRDSTALAKEIVSMLQLSDHSYRHLAQRARKRVQEHFGLHTYIDAHASLYHQLLGLFVHAEETRAALPLLSKSSTRAFAKPITSKHSAA